MNHPQRAASRGTRRHTCLWIALWGVFLTFGLPEGQGFAAAAKGRGSLYQRAMEDYQAFKYTEALQILDQARKQTEAPEQHVSIDLLDGVIRFEIGQPEQAGDSFRRALIINPKAQLSFDVSPKITELLEKVRTESSPAPPVVQPPPPPPKPVDAPVAPRPTDTPRTSTHTEATSSKGLSAARVPLAIAGGGVAIVGVLSWVKALSVAQQIKRADASITTRDQLDGLVRQGKTFETAGWILMGAGAATALGSLLLIHPSSTAPTAMVMPTQGGAYGSLQWSLP